MAYTFFVNYRRDDASAEAVNIKSLLCRHFGDESTFMDTASIRAGDPWANHIREALSSATTVIVVIGPGWLTAGQGPSGQRRIDDPDDWVRLEIEHAFSGNKRVIPVLVRGASLPLASALPDSIKRLTTVQPIEIRRDYWDHDIQLLVGQLDGQPDAPKKAKWRDILESAERESVKQLEHFVREMTTMLAPLEKHASLIAENPLIVEFLRNRSPDAEKPKIRQILLGHSEIGPYATTFLLDRNGICVENSRHVLSIGKDYSLRPYFKDAMRNVVGRFPAIGVTSRKLGYHVAYPVHHDGHIIGAACVEVDMEQISTQSRAFVQTETRGADSAWIRALADENGVIMLSSEDSWVYRSISEIPEHELQLIRKTRQYPSHKLDVIERFDSTETRLLGSMTPNLTIRGLSWKDSLGEIHNRIFVIREAKITGGWRVLIFWELKRSI